MPERMAASIYQHSGNGCHRESHNPSCPGARKTWAGVCSKPPGSLLWECHHLDDDLPAEGGSLDVLESAGSAESIET